MPLVFDATVLQDLARGLRVLAISCRNSAEKQEGSTQTERFLNAAAELERRAKTLDEFASRGGTFEIRRR